MDKSRQIRGVLWQNVRIHSANPACAKFTAYSKINVSSAAVISTVQQCGVTELQTDFFISHHE